jgi:hypothetical protein
VASSGHAQISLLWRGLPALWWLAWPAGVSRLEDRICCDDGSWSWRAAGAGVSVLYLREW